MSTTRGLILTDAERHRVERIDQLVALGGPSVGELIESLSDASWTVRRAAVAALAALGDDACGPLCTWLRDTRTSEHALAAVVDALSTSIGGGASVAVLPLLDAADPAVVADAARVLGRRRASEASIRLAHLLDHADDNVAVAAIESLGEIGGAAAIDALVQVVSRKNFFRTYPALQVLAKTGDPRVIAPIAALLDDDGFRIEAARALGRTGSAIAIAPLVSLLPRASDTMVRLVAGALADLISRATWSGSAAGVRTSMRADVTPARAQFVAALRGSDAQERTAIAMVLGTIGDAGTLSVLVELLGDAEVQGVASAAIQQIGGVHAAALLEAIEHGTTATRTALLPLVRASSAGASVRQLLTDEDPEVRARACEALGRIGDTASVPALFAALDDANPRVTYAATAAIHSLGIAGTAGLAIQALSSTRPNVRRHALRIIAYLGCEEAFDVVRTAIEDPDVRISELAVTALGVLEDPRVEPILLELALRPSDSIRAAAMRAAAHRGGDTMGELLARGLGDEAAWVRYYACQGLGRIARGSSTSVLIERLADAYPHVRIAAIEALARIDTPQAWQALTSVVRSLDPDEQRAALVGMSQAPRPAAIPYLLEAARSAQVATRLIALAGLAVTTDPLALHELEIAARGTVEELREAALSLLAERTDAAAARVLIELALASEPEHPAHLALSLASPTRIVEIAARLSTADDQTASVLAAALARMGAPGATAALFETLSTASAPARRAAAASLIAIDAAGARGAVAQLAAEDPDPEVRRACAAAMDGRAS